MREKSEGTQNSTVEKRAEEWRSPQRSDSIDSAPAANLTITICVTEGRSAHVRQRLIKSSTTIGNLGGGADMQIDDPKISALHCAVALAQDGARIYDLDSTHGTYVEDEQVQMADLKNLSAFRLGSTEFVVLIAPKHLGEA